MGTWGVGILADDDAMEVYEGYRRLYNQGDDHPAVRLGLERDCADLLKDDDLGPVFWLALARAQWEYGVLDADVLQRVTDISEQGLGLERWRAEGARVAAKRQKVVSEFLNKIRLPNPKPKKRKPERKFPAIFEPGDCLAIPLSDGRFGAAFVVSIDNGNEIEGLDFVGLLEYHGAEKPPLDIFQTARWTSPPPIGPFLPSISTFRMVLARTHRNEGRGIERLAQRQARSDTPKYNRTGVVGGWDSVRMDIELYYELLSFDDPAARESYFKIQYYVLRVAPNHHAEFEPILLGGYEDLKARRAKIHGAERSRILSNSAKQLVQFYEGWGKPEEVTRWRNELDQLSADRES